MTAITLTLTDAGLAALTNPAHTGTAALTISDIGLSQKHAGDVAVQQALTALPGEFKRLATFGGEVLSPRTIHVFLRDESADAYSLRAIGLYASTGVLLAVVSSDIPMMEKVPATTLLQAVDLTFARDIDAELTFGDTNFVNPPATTTRLGVVELATAAETVAGERQDLAVTPWGLAQALLSWAQNFAAKAHRHLISEIDGLSDALAAKANRNHTHGADDVNTGVFHIDRIPKLAIGWITGLTDQLAGLAAKVHQHPASDINSGQLHLDRVPLLPLSKVNGLVSALAEKASALHSHTMAQVSGLIDALAAKAPLNAPIFSGIVEAPQFQINAVASVARRIVLRTAGVARWTLGATGSGEAGGNAGSDFTIDRYSDAGSYIGAAFSINRATGQTTLSTRPNFGRDTPWDTANFDPDAKANVSHTPVSLGNIPAGVDLYTFITPGVARQNVSSNPTLALNYPLANERGTLIVLNGFGANGTIGSQLYIGRTSARTWTRSYDGSVFTPWTETWTTNNFDPGSKANLASPAFTGTPTAPTQAAGNDSTRIATTAFVRQELNTAIAPLATTAAMNAADALKAPLASPALTGTPTAPTQAAGDASTRIATTAFVRQELSTAIAPLATTAAMNAADALKAPLASPALTGTPTAPTQAAGNDSTRIATTAFVRQEVNSAIEPLATTAAMNAADALKAPLASPALTGTPTAPTQTPGNNSTRLATTAFVQRAISDIPAPPNASTSIRGLALLATDAQTQAGTDDGRAVTPAALWSFAKSIGLNGYAQVPGTPLVIQWGRQVGSMTEGQRTVMLPIAFGGGCVAMLANPWNSSPTADYYMQIVGRYLDRLIFMLNSASGSSGSAQGFDWLAVGLATGTPNPAYSTGGGGGGGGGGLPPGGGGEEPIIRPEV